MSLGQQQMKLSEVLQAARSRIAAPAQWTQHTMARDATGRPTQPTHERASYATCWCASAAIRLAASPELFSKAIAACEAVIPVGVSLPWFNDHRSHAEVLEMFDRAIAKAIAAEAKE